MEAIVIVLIILLLIPAVSRAHAKNVADELEIRADNAAKLEAERECGCPVEWDVSLDAWMPVRETKVSPPQRQAQPQKASGSKTST